MLKFPKNNLDGLAQPWVRAVESALQGLEGAASRRAQGETNANKGSTSDFKTLAKQVRDTVATVATLKDVVAKLVAAGTAVVSETTAGVTGFAGFYTGTRPSVQISSPTGRLQIDFGGSLNGGTGYLVYSITNPINGEVIVNRATLQGNPARRIAISGGSSFAPSSFRTAFESVPADTTVAVTLEMYATDTFTYFLGGSIAARPSL